MWLLLSAGTLWRPPKQPSESLISSSHREGRLCLRKTYRESRCLIRANSLFLLTALPRGWYKSHVTDELTEALRGGHSPKDTLLGSSRSQGMVTWSIPGQRLCRWRSGKESTWQFRRLGFGPWVGKIPGVGDRTHCSILAWETPRTEELGGPQSMGSQSVGLNPEIEYTHTHTWERGR